MEDGPVEVERTRVVKAAYIRENKWRELVACVVGHVAVLVVHAEPWAAEAGNDAEERAEALEELAHLRKPELDETDLATRLPLRRGNAARASAPGQRRSWRKRDACVVSEKHRSIQRSGRVGYRVLDHHQRASKRHARHHLCHKRMTATRLRISLDAGGSNPPRLVPMYTKGVPVTAEWTRRLLGPCPPSARLSAAS